MKKTILFTILALLTLTPEIANPSPEKLSEASKLSINTLGELKIGMTVKEASQSAGIQLIPRRSGGEPYCYYYKPQKGLTGVEFMVTEGRISRIDVYNPRVTTLSGAKIGDSEAKIKSLYPNQIETQPHEYISRGHYLIFIPKDNQDKAYRLVFETDGKKLTSLRSGKVPEVLWVEGCV